MLRNFFLLLAFSVSLNAFAQNGNFDIPKNVFEGKWIMPKGNKFIGEEWVKISDTYLENKGYFIKGTDTVITERVTLKKINGEIFYTSTVEGQNDQKPVDFKLTSINGSIYTFENPLHDFPKRIVYDFTTAGSLHAYIDDGTASKSRVDFYYKKVN